MHIVTDQRKLKNVEFFKNLCNLITNDAIFYVKMNLGFPCKSNIQQEKGAFCSTLGLICKDESSKVLRLRHRFCCVETEHFGRQITQKLNVGNVLLEKVGNQLD